MVQEGAQDGAQEGMEHWRRAVAWTFAGIFVVSLLGGLLGRVTSGTGLAASASGPPHHNAALRAAPASETTRTGPDGARAVSGRVAAQGERALLTLSDLPPGWASGVVPALPARVSPWSSGLAGCVGVPARLAALTPTKVDSPDFTSSDKVLAVEDGVSIYPSAAAAQAEYAAMASTKTIPCMNSVAGPALQSNMQRRASAGTTVGTVTFTSLPAGAAARHVTGFSVAIPLVRSGRELTITSTEVDFVQGARLQQVTFDGNGTAFPVALEEQLLAAAERTH